MPSTARPWKQGRKNAPKGVESGALAHCGVVWSTVSRLDMAGFTLCRRGGTKYRSPVAARRPVTSGLPERVTRPAGTGTPRRSFMDSCRDDARNVVFPSRCERRSFRERPGLKRVPAETDTICCAPTCRSRGMVWLPHQPDRGDIPARVMACAEMVPFAAANRETRNPSNNGGVPCSNARPGLNRLVPHQRTPVGVLPASPQGMAGHLTNRWHRDPGVTALGTMVLLAMDGLRDRSFRCKGNGACRPSGVGTRLLGTTRRRDQINRYHRMKAGLSASHPACVVGLARA